MAVNVFLTLNGGQTKFQGTVEVKSFSWGVENTSTPGSATGGAGAGKAKFQEASLQNYNLLLKVNHALGQCS